MTLGSTQLFVTCMICMVVRAEDPLERNARSAAVQIQQAHRVLQRAENLTCVPTASSSLEQLQPSAKVIEPEHTDNGAQYGNPLQAIMSVDGSLTARCCYK